MMKKFLLLALALVLAFTLTACSSTFKCGMCLEEKSGRQYENEFLGEEIVICHDCYSEMKELADLFMQ